MFQILLIALAQVKADNASWNLLNEIRQIIYSLSRAKVSNYITKKLFNNVMNSVKLSNKMDTIFKNFDNNKTFDPHRLLINLADKINLKRSDKYVPLSNLNIYYTWKNIKKSYKNNEFKIPVPLWNEEFELRDGSYSVSDIQDYFKYIIKNMRQWLITLQ